MGSSCEGDALILCRLLGFAVNSFDRPPQLGAVGPVVYALNEFSPLSSFVSTLLILTFGSLHLRLSLSIIFPVSKSLLITLTFGFESHYVNIETNNFQHSNKKYTITIHINIIGIAL